MPLYFRRLARGIRPGRNELESVNRRSPSVACSCAQEASSWQTVTASLIVPRERAENVASAALPFLDNVARERYMKETGRDPWKQQIRGRRVACPFPSGP